MSEGLLAGWHLEKAEGLKAEAALKELKEAEALLTQLNQDRRQICQLYTFLSVERNELDRNYAPSVCDWLYST